MIKTYTATTYAVVDPSEAIEEILEQLDLENMLLKNSVGILCCHYDYVKNGTVKMLCEGLPFNVLGAMTRLSAVQGESGNDLLSLTVLTSDDVYFSSGVSGPLQGADVVPLTSLYKDLEAQCAKKPALCFGFIPHIDQIGSEYLLPAFEKASDGVPFFGSVSFDVIDQEYISCIIYNGQEYADCMALLLFSGNVNPEFMITAVSPEKMMKQKAIVTEAEGNIIKTINDMPALEYIQSLGIATNIWADGAPSVPLMIDTRDGSEPVARNILTTTPQGGIVCWGVVPQGATLGIGRTDSEEIIATTRQMAQTLHDKENKQILFFFSCLVRNMVLGLAETEEAKQVQAVAGADTPFLFMYVAGEFCPVRGSDGWSNKFHNSTIIACAL